jgi:DNA-binding response OmpR family regulator
VTGVVLVSRDWQFRALLRAQLIEEGCRVRAFESIRDLEEELKGTAFEPGLIVADLSGGEEAGELEQLSAWSRRVPVWAIAGHGLDIERQLEDRGFEAVILRPIGIEELVERVKQRLAAS